MNGTVNLAAGWATLWSAISGVIGGQIQTLLTIGGVLLVLGAITSYFWSKRRGGRAGQGIGILIWTLICGAILASPQIIIPIVLMILDLGINLIIAIVSNSK